MEYTYFVNPGSWFFIVFLVFSAFRTAVASILDWLDSDKGDVGKKLARLHSFGETAKKLFSTRKVNKALKYKNASESYGNMVETVFSAMGMCLVVFGVLPFMTAAFGILLPGSSLVFRWTAALLVSTLAGALFRLPFDYHRDFGIEKAYGFNTKTVRMFAVDAILATVISLALCATCQYGLDWVLGKYGNSSAGDLLASVVFLAAAGKLWNWFSVNVLMPMFNKFEPLKDKKLAKKLKDLCDGCGFKVSAIETMDASKRNRHSNAFICRGFGKPKIVLFDTMLDELTTDEIVSVVAHEIGHGKLHHLLFSELLSLARLSALMCLSFVLMKIPAFYNAFGYSWVREGNVQENYVIGFYLSMMFLGCVSWTLEPFWNWLSRKMEFAADRFAAGRSRKLRDLENALLKLTSGNLSDVIPHPAYEFFNRSHPSIANRLEALRKAKRCQNAKPGT